MEGTLINIKSYPQQLWLSLLITMLINFHVLDLFEFYPCDTESCISPQAFQTFSSQSEELMFGMDFA